MGIDFSKFETKDWIHIILLSIATIGVGCLFIFSFKRDLFIELDYVKLLLLASSITLPAWLVNTSIAAIYNMATNPNPKPQLMSVAGSAITIGIFLVTILLNYYLSLNCKWVVGSTIILEILLFITVGLYADKKDKNKESKKK